MPFTTNGFFYFEVGGSPTYQLSKDSASATDTWMVPWADAHVFARTQIPFIETEGGFSLAGTRAVHRYDLGLRAETVDISPFYSEEPGITGNSPASEWSVVKISYKVPDRKDSEDEDPDDPETFLTHKLTIGAEMMTVPPRKAEVPDDPNRSPGETPVSEGGFLPDEEAEIDKKMTDEDAPITLLMPTAEHQFSWKRVLYPPFGAIYNAIGKLNASAFAGCAAETLMFLGVDAQREFTTDGQEPWTLDYRFSHRCSQPIGAPNPLTWNHFYVPKKGTWEKLRFNGQLAYRTTDFSGLFYIT